MNSPAQNGDSSHCPHHHRSDSANSSSFQLYCPCCVVDNPGREHTDSDARTRANNLDFSTSGPPLSICDLCNQPYEGWEVSAEQWQLLPECYRHYSMCENDFLQLLAEEGQDVDSVKITHEAWSRKQDEWKSRSDAPKQDTNIRFSWDEIMWCTVLEVNSDGTYLVQLFNSNIFDQRMKKGTYLVAKWNGSRRHGLSGRPMLEPIRRVKAPRTSRKATFPKEFIGF